MTERLDSVEWSRLRWAELQGPEPERFAAMVAVLRLDQLLRSRLNQVLREHDLTRTAFLILTALRLPRDRTLSLGALSRRLLLHPTTVSLAIEKLQRRGLVVRAPHPSDGRTILVSLTDEGDRLLGVVSRDLSAQDYGLGGADTETVTALTDIIRQALRAMGDR